MAVIENIRAGSKGQATLEFALCVPIFLLMVFGLIDLARYYFYEQSVTHTVRAASRFAVTGQLFTNQLQNTSLPATNPVSWPYMKYRASVVKAAFLNNPAKIPIVYGGSTNLSNWVSGSGQPTDTLTIIASSNLATVQAATAWGNTNLYGSAKGGEYIGIRLRYAFEFITPFADILARSINNGQPIEISSSIIVRNEGFETNTYGNNGYWQ
jgi:hypothetical protein